MATYRPSFIDTSGLTQGISKGLEILAQQKRQDDAIAEARVDDFMKMYQPGKLMQNHIPEFTNAYNNYKQSALQYSKLNRGGGKPEELAVAKAKMDNALSGLNTIYSTSIKTSEKLAETADVLKIARSKGLSIPKELNETYGILSSAPVSQLVNTVDKIASPYSYKLLSEDVDFTKLFKDFDLLGARAKQATQFIDNPNSGYTFMGKPLASRTKVTIESRNPLEIKKSLPIILADPTHNGLKIQMDNQYNSFKQLDPESKAQTVEILKPIFNINTADEITPDMLLSYRLASSNISKQEDDQNFIKMQMDEIRLQSQIDEKEKDRQARALEGDKNRASRDSKSDKVLSSHPSVIINSIMESSTKPNTTNGVDVSRDMGGFTLKTVYGSMPINDIKYFSGDPSKKIQPYFKIKIGNEEIVKSPEALNSLIVQSAPDITFKGGVDVYKSIPSIQMAPPKPKKSGKSGVGTLGLNLPVTEANNR